VTLAWKPERKPHPSTQAVTRLQHPFVLA